MYFKHQEKNMNTQAYPEISATRKKLHKQYSGCISSPLPQAGNKTSCYQQMTVFFTVTRIAALLTLL